MGEKSIFVKEGTGIYPGFVLPGIQLSICTERFAIIKHIIEEMDPSGVDQDDPDGPVCLADAVGPVCLADAVGPAHLVDPVGPINTDGPDDPLDSQYLLASFDRTSQRLQVHHGKMKYRFNFVSDRFFSRAGFARRCGPERKVGYENA